MARDTNRSGRSSRRGRSSAPAEANASPAGGVDLAGVLRGAGVAEERIPETIATIRALSDAQAGEGTPPPVPTPAPLDSFGEMTIASAASDFSADREWYRELTSTALAAGKTAILDARRDGLWAMEWKVLRQKVPRASFVGRAIRSTTRRHTSRTGYIQIYETIKVANDRLLSESLRNALQIIRDGPTAETQDQRRKQSTDASSLIRKNLDVRLSLLADDLHYVEAERGTQGKQYKLTPRGRRVFDGWPKWDTADAMPGVGAGESAPEEEADAGTSPSSD